jgi:hypothetical protein
MPYPPRPQRHVLEEFRGTASSRPDPAVQTRVEAFIVDQYTRGGLSLRELGELTERSHSSVRNILERNGIRRRGTGAAGLRQADAWHRPGHHPPPPPEHA